MAKCYGGMKVPPFSMLQNRKYRGCALVPSSFVGKGVLCLWEIAMTSTTTETEDLLRDVVETTEQEITDLETTDIETIITTLSMRIMMTDR